MPGSRRPSGLHRRSHSEMADDGDVIDPDNQFSPDVKRARLSPNEEEGAIDEETQENSPEYGDDDDDDEDAQEDEEDEESEEPHQPTQPQVARPGVDSQGYKPGAIIRIKVTDFVTYTSAEFHPGPKLNMVIGPNGTGKSTLVCAICLGLGWGPQHLGRAKELGEFVKHGRAEATIEIELAGGPQKTNPVIKRKIKRDGNQSSFSVNGTSTPLKQVQRLVQSYGVQVDNLCQFLPQDKVAEFAALTPEQLLFSTERAAGGRRMIDWHDALNKLRNEQRRIEVDNRGDTETLRNMETRHDAQREDVERMRERVVIQQKIDNMELLRPIVEYRDFCRTYEELKAKQTRLSAEQEQMKKDLQPILQVVDDKKSYAARIGEVRARRKVRLAQISNSAASAKQKVASLQNEIAAIDGKIANERESGRRHKEEAQKISQTIKRLERQMREEPVEFDHAYFNALLSERRQRKRTLEDSLMEIRSKRDPLRRQIETIKRRISENEQQLKNLDSKSGQKENQLNGVSRDTAKGYQWLRRNQHRFEKEVFGPAMVTCSVTDLKYADAIEACMQKSDLLSFTVQSKKDFKTLQQALLKDEKLHDISIRTCPPGSNWKRVPIPKEDIKRLGFDGYASDFLEGPEPVIAMLYEEMRLGATPIALREITEQAYETMVGSPLAQFVSGKTVYQVTRRREYGDGATSTKTRTLRKAQVWTDQPIDMSAKQGYLNEIGSSREELQHLQTQIEEHNNAAKKLEEDAEVLDSEIRNINNEKAEKQTAHTNFMALPQTIEQEQSKLKVRQDGFTEVRERVGELRKSQDETAIKKAEATLKYADIVEKFREAYEELMRTEVLHLEAASDTNTLELRRSGAAEMLAEKSRQVSQLIEQVDAQKGRGQELRRESKRIMRHVSDREGIEEVNEAFSVDGYNMDSFNADLDSEKARLALTHGGHSGMLEEFEARERKIQELKDKLSSSIQQTAKIQEGIDEIRGQWEPQLEAIVSRISDAFGDSFRRIGLAGQVGLFKAEDEASPNDEHGPSNFEHWAIQIQVKFRENEPLSILTAHRQSGGERAVSTIFYLMALQSLSTSPFRVVDEINQGMDPRNERMVHGRLVDIACGTDDEQIDERDSVGGGGGSQYFLITPKLLTGLSYKRGMKVLTIYSGEHMPGDYTRLGFRRAAQKMREITGHAASAPNPVNVY